MSIPPRLASRLNEVMGAGAAEDLVTWMDDTSARHAELRADLAEIRQEIRAVELRLSAELSRQLHAQTVAINAQFGAVNAQFGAVNAQFAEVNARIGPVNPQFGSVTAQIAELAKEFRAELHMVDNKIEKRFSDLLLWSFVFWVGAVGAIALLAGVLRP